MTITILAFTALFCLSADAFACSSCVETCRQCQESVANGSCHGGWANDQRQGKQFDGVNMITTAAILRTLTACTGILISHTALNLPSTTRLTLGSSAFPNLQGTTQLSDEFDFLATIIGVLSFTPVCTTDIASLYGIQCRRMLKSATSN